ncbi:MAG TPA: AAA family ATPase [Solirubrobacteraceae bacterium]|jgi:DNA-binding SARP family transcriptional activator/DNA-binding NarL/FixJ family response regulator|nr:AAA family ATPase [Solirubrobacteraceae bacterium]
MLRIRLLGELAVETSSGPIELSGSWRARSLLAWLALNPGSHQRADVAARFWPEVLDSSARASLRNAIWAIRRSLGSEASGALLATRERIGLDGPGVWIDGSAFREHMENERFAEALELCRGDILAGLDDEWVYEFRDAHRERLSELLERMSAQSDAQGDPAGAIAHTRRRVALDPLAEDAQRALIARLAAAGDRAGALGAYARLRDRFRRDLGISPSQQTRELALAIRDDAPAGEPTEPREPSLAQTARAPTGAGWTPGAAFPLPPGLRQPAPAAFVGRAEELSTLRQLWSHVRDGDGARIALLTGEPGVGKSRLARELALEAREHRAIVLHGSANEDLLVPYQPFVEAIRHYLAVAGPDELRRRVHPRAGALEPITPSLPRQSGEHRPDGARVESRRYRLFDAVASLLAELSADAPVLLVLDDLHWADQSSAALLRHILELRPHIRLLVLATQRQTETAPGSPLAQALQRLTQHELLERVPLAGLVDADVAELSRSLTGRELSAELVHAIRRDAAGNPFFAQEIVRHLSESDRSGGALSLAHADMPESIREVVNLRLAPLGDACVRLLTVAAVIGAEFELDPLERISDLEGEDLAAALDEALAAELVLELAHSDNERFAFSHALVRRTLLERLSRAHRRRIHARVAEALQASRGEAALPEIAYHLCEAMPAVNREHALDYATRAAEQATADLAYAEAVDLFTRALSLLPHDHERRRILALKRALAYQALTHLVMDTARPETRADPIAISPSPDSVKV